MKKKAGIILLCFLMTFALTDLFGCGEKDGTDVNSLGEAPGA